MLEEGAFGSLLLAQPQHDFVEEVGRDEEVQLPVGLLCIVQCFQHEGGYPEKMRFGICTCTVLALVSRVLVTNWCTVQ